MHSFSEELALLTSAAIYNFVWGSFTFLASKVVGQSMETLLKVKDYSDARMFLAWTCLPWNQSDLLHLPGALLIIQNFSSKK